MVLSLMSSLIAFDPQPEVTQFFLYSTEGAKGLHPLCSTLSVLPGSPPFPLCLHPLSQPFLFPHSLHTRSVLISLGPFGPFG